MHPIQESDTSPQRKRLAKAWVGEDSNPGALPPPALLGSNRRVLPGCCCQGAPAGLCAVVDIAHRGI